MDIQWKGKCWGNHNTVAMDTRVYCRKTIGEVPINTSILSDGKYRWLSIDDYLLLLLTDTTGSCRSLVDDENVPSQKCHNKSHPVKSCECHVTTSYLLFYCKLYSYQTAI